MSHFHFQCHSYSDSPESGNVAWLIFTGYLNIMASSFSVSKTASSVFSDVLLKSTWLSFWHLVCPIMTEIFTFLVEWITLPSPTWMILHSLCPPFSITHSVSAHKHNDEAIFLHTPFCGHSSSHSLIVGQRFLVRCSTAITATASIFPLPIEHSPFTHAQWVT